jgi:hypothetical protein
MIDPAVIWMMVILRRLFLRDAAELAQWQWSLTNARGLHQRSNFRSLTCWAGVRPHPAAAY